MHIDNRNAPASSIFVQPTGTTTFTPPSNQSVGAEEKPVQTNIPNDKSTNLNTAPIEQPSSVNRHVPIIRKPNPSKLEPNNMLHFKRVSLESILETPSNNSNPTNKALSITRLPSIVDSCSQFDSHRPSLLFNHLTEKDPNLSSQAAFDDSGSFCSLAKGIQFALQQWLGQEGYFVYNQDELIREQLTVSGRSKSKSLVRQHGFFLSSGHFSSEPAQKEEFSDKQYIEPWTEEEQPAFLSSIQTQPSKTAQISILKATPLFAVNRQPCENMWPIPPPLTTEKMLHKVNHQP